MSRVVVVGGGLGGTAAAARLAKLGHRVTLVERRERLGGAIGFVERDGFRWDAGPSWTALPAVLRDLFRKSGRPLERELELVPVQPLRRHVFGDGTELDLPSGSRSAQLDAVGSTLGPDPARQWVDHVHAQAGTWDLLRRAWLEHPWSSDLADPRASALLRSRTSLRRATRRRLSDPRLRAAALAPAVLDGQRPGHLPAWWAMWDYVEQNFGTWTVPGGLGALAGLLERRLAERRVEVLLTTTARDLVVEDGRVRGVETDGGALEADVVVCGVDPRTLPALRRKLGHATTVDPPAVSHLGLAGDLPDLPHEVVLHGDPLVVVRTGGGSPEGSEAWTVLVRGTAPPDLLATMADRGIDVRGLVVARVDRSPGQQVAELGGSPYGVGWRGRQTTRRRLAAPPVAGVHLVGVHAAAGAGVPQVGLTAAVAAERIGPGRGRGR